MGDNGLPVLKGMLDVLTLKALSCGEMHGFGILSWLEDQSGGVLGIEDSALYQALHRMEARGLIEAEWRVTEHKRRARYYRLTEQGWEQLRTQSADWYRYAGAVGGILGEATEQG